MGWNGWYADACDFNAQMIEQTAQEMVSDGLKAAGYRYVNLDDCWMSSSRDASGNLVPDPAKFPNGIVPVIQYVHSLGLKFGIYEDEGTQTCAHDPGSYGYENQDAATFASWGVDYLKYDRCNVPFGDFPGQTHEQVEQTLNTRMSNALARSGRQIVFAMCNGPDPGAFPWVWGGSVSNLWRTGPDVADTYSAMLSSFEQTVGLYRYAHPGAWNDPDILQIGNGGMSTLEYQSQFSLWAEMAAPLIAGANLGSLPAADLAMYENRSVIAVDQDPLGEQAVPISSRGGLWVLSKPLHDGQRSVVLFNSTDAPATISTSAGAVGLPRGRSYSLDDLWSGHVSESTGAIADFLAPHAAAMLRVATISKRRATRLAPATVLALAATPNQADNGRPIMVKESLSDEGSGAVERVRLLIAAPGGWKVKALSPQRASRLAGGHTLIARFRVSPPPSPPALTTVNLTGTAFASIAGHVHTTVASFGELFASPLRPPLQSANTTGETAVFGQTAGVLAIQAAGTGISAPSTQQPASDSYAAIYSPGAAATVSNAQVTVSSSSDAGLTDASGLIERNSIAGASPPGVALYLNARGAIVMTWTSGGAGVDSSFTVPGLTVTPPLSSNWPGLATRTPAITRPMAAPPGRFSTP